MNIDDLSALLALILAISLATERLVAIVRTVFPSLMPEETNRPANRRTVAADRQRLFFVQFLAFAAGWTTSAFLAKDGIDFLGDIVVKGSTTEFTIPVYVMGLLSSGGSTFWKDILGWTKAMRDSRQLDAASEGAKQAQGKVLTERMGLIQRNKTKILKAAASMSAAAAPPTL